MEFELLREELTDDEEFLELLERVWFPGNAKKKSGKELIILKYGMKRNLWQDLDYQNGLYVKFWTKYH